MHEPTTKAAVNEFLTGISDYFEAHTDDAGKNICAKHNVEHTGKTVYSIGIDAYLYRLTGKQMYRRRAAQRAVRIAGQLQEERGRHFFTSEAERWNMSNRIIDSGAGSDMFALALKEDLIEEKHRAQIEDALRKNCGTYLIETVTDKAHTNQRLWGAAGLAAGYALMKEDAWKQAVLDSIAMSVEEIRADGSIPYVTNYKKNGHNPSIVDTTTYYHSRHIAFMWYALEQVGELQDSNFIEPMQRATDFLIGMYQQDGVKNIDLETKRWYFLSPYEIASHSYDVNAFFKLYQHTNDSEYAKYGNRALQQLLRHRIREDEGIDDHINGRRNFQCPYFWNSHCVWLTRVADMVEQLPAGEEDRESVRMYKDASIVHVAKQKYACILRGSKKPRNTIWGPRIGGGSLLYFGTKEEGFHNKLQSGNELPRAAALNFYTKRPAKNFEELLPTNIREIRMLGFYAYVELWARNLPSFITRCRILLRQSMSPFIYHSSQNCTDVIMEQPDGLTFIFHSQLAKEDGTPWAGSTLTRTYCLEDDGLKVTEALSFNQESPRKIFYRCLSDAQTVECTADGTIRKRNQLVTITKATTINISYTL